MPLIRTTRGEIDEMLLVRRDEEHEIREGEGEQLYHAIVKTTEFCMRGCEGPAHQSGVRDAAGHFCNAHVRRDVHLTVLHVPATFAAVSQ